MLTSAPAIDSWGLASPTKYQWFGTCKQWYTFPGSLPQRRRACTFCSSDNTCFKCRPLILFANHSCVNTSHKTYERFMDSNWKIHKFPKKLYCKGPGYCFLPSMWTAGPAIGRWTQARGPKTVDPGSWTNGPRLLDPGSLTQRVFLSTQYR